MPFMEDETNDVKNVVLIVGMRLSSDITLLPKQPHNRNI